MNGEQILTKLQKWIALYGLKMLAAEAKAAWAVGTALATNPFPIIIPCHHAIRSDGTLGGYQGGLAMKRALLEMEGILFDSSSHVVTEDLYY